VLDARGPVSDDDELVDLREQRRDVAPHHRRLLASRDDHDRGDLHASASRYAAAVRRAVSSHVNALARSIPAADSRSRSASARRTPSVTSAPKTAASPATSRIASSVAATTGVPHAIASTSGRPKPSCFDGRTTQAACRYRRTSSSFGT